MTKKEDYLTLLTYDKKELLLDGLSLPEIANMHPKSIKDFTMYIEVLLLKENLNNYQVVKTKTYTTENYQANFELKVKEKEYDKIKELIFDFAFICCSNLVEEQKSDYWKTKDWNFRDTFNQSMKLFKKGEIHALYNNGHRDKYSIKITNNQKLNNSYREEKKNNKALLLTKKD